MGTSGALLLMTAIQHSEQLNYVYLISLDFLKVTCS